MKDARWLFFDLGNTLISKETATARRIQQLGSSLERFGRRVDALRAAGAYLILDGAANCCRAD